MSYLNETFAAGETKRFEATGTFFLLMNAAAAVNATFFRNRTRLNESVQGITTGFSFKDLKGFDAVEITSATAQTVQIITSEGEVGFASSVNVAGGSVAVTGDVFVGGGTSSNITAPAVTNASAQILSLRTGRRRAFIQNKSLTGTIWLFIANSAGQAATQANGIKLSPGQSLDLAGPAPYGYFTAIGDIANNPDVFVMENF